MGEMFAYDRSPLAGRHPAGDRPGTGRLHPALRPHALVADLRLRRLRREPDRGARLHALRRPGRRLRPAAALPVLPGGRVQDAGARPYRRRCRADGAGRADRPAAVLDRAAGGWRGGRAAGSGLLRRVPLPALPEPDAQRYGPVHLPADRRHCGSVQSARYARPALGGSVGRRLRAGRADQDADRAGVALAGAVVVAGAGIAAGHCPERGERDRAAAADRALGRAQHAPARGTGADQHQRRQQPAPGQQFLRGGLSIPWLGRAVGQLHRARAGGSERNGGGSLAPRAGAGLPGRAPRRVAAPVLDEAVGAVESGDHALRPAA